MFAVLNAEVKRYQREYNAKQYEAELNTAKLAEVTSHITDLESTYGKDKLKNNDSYQDLVAYQVAYDEKKDSLDTELSFLKSTLDSFKSARNEGVKEAGKFWCFG